MIIALASDHAGFALKEKIKDALTLSGHTVLDSGAGELNPSDDYPDFVIPAAQAISEGKAERGIILGGSGQGEAIAANRFSNVRAGVYYGGDERVVVLLREHNDANILSLGARFLKEEEALAAVDLFLGTDFPGEERHARRIKKIER